ncbi:MAG: FadR family transcriptional regulator, partial [Zoogloeaceae bacterium]|nr:FadR family transcriptional regulator [Zoogloeaceae bacterium]
MAGLQPVERPLSLAEVVARQLETWVRQGGLAAGAQLPSEKELVGRFGVSRAVIREAVSRLKADGWIESRQGAGAFVTPQGRRGSFRLVPGGSPGAATLGDIFELRSLVEAGAAELAAQRRQPADLAQLAEALARMEAALVDADGAADGPSADDAFHVAIAAATGNPMIQQFVVFMGQQFSDSRRPTWDGAGQEAGRAA